MNKEEAGSCRSSVLVLSLCRVHCRERPVWSCEVVEWFGRPPNEQPVAWSDSWSHRRPAVARERDIEVLMDAEREIAREMGWDPFSDGIFLSVLHVVRYEHVW